MSQDREIQKFIKTPVPVGALATFGKKTDKVCFCRNPGRGGIGDRGLFLFRGTVFISGHWE